MLKSDIAFSHIVIDEDIEGCFSLYNELLSDERCVGYIKDDFLIEDTKSVIAEAYIAEDRSKYLILGAKSFNTVSQNALLKVLEEPPRNIIFIIIAPSKATLLPTVRSRLLLKNRKNRSSTSALDIVLKDLELDTLFVFIKENERLSRHESKSLVESIYTQAVFVDKIVLDLHQCEAFERAMKLIDLNSKVSTILLNLLTTFLKKRVNVN